MVKRSKYDPLYRQEDKTFLINDLDPDSKTIEISLPSAPKNKHLIDGYGLHPDEQYFKRIETPKRLKHIETQTIRTLQEAQKKNKQEPVTGYKIIQSFWKVIEDDPEEYESEIEFIKRIWWYRLHGYWFYNDGQPTYITGRHFMFLNFFYQPDIKGNDGYPEYRDRHRREYLFRAYLRTTTESFARRDEKGIAIPEDDGSYKMVDMGVLLSFGDIHPKSRRNGSTMMGLSDMIEDTERKFGAYSTIISKDGESTEKHFQTKLLPAWSSRAYYLRPVWQGSSSPNQIKYYPPRNNYVDECLMGVIDYTMSAGEIKQDGNKINGMLVADEEGKTAESQILTRHNVNRNAQSLGDGSIILGYSSHISTVEEISQAGEEFLALLDQSNFYQRGDSGQTLSGLMAMFFPAYDGQEGFIDRWGMSVIENPTERQIALAPPSSVYSKLGKGAKQYQQEKRDDYASRGTASATRSLREYIKKYPWRTNELYMGTSGDLGFNYDKMDKRLAELRRLKSVEGLPIKVGNFYRVNNDPNGDVYWKTEPDTGKFMLAMELPRQLTNLKREAMGWDVNKGEFVPMWEPLRKTKFTVGADPVEFDNTQKTVTTSRQSDGGIAVLWERDEDIDRSSNPNDWDSRRCVLYYRYRPASLVEYCEDVLMVAEYFSCLVFPENNKTRLWEYLIERGRGGYLKYQIDPRTGKRADKPGWYATASSKNTMFGEWKDYIESRIHKEVLIPLIEEARNIRSMDEMTKYDGFAAFGAALMGSRSPDGKMEERMASMEIDLGGCDFLNRRPM